MINSVSNSNISFTGRNISPFNSCPIKTKSVAKKVEYFGIPAQNYKMFLNINKTKPIKLVRETYGYSVGKDSTPLEIYTGPQKTLAGYSTEAEGGFGGGWIKGRMNMPLSSRNFHSCAGLNLVNEEGKTQIFFHVYHETTTEDIINFISQKFPQFNKVNIIPGDNPKTNNTVNNILKAVNAVNQDAEKHFYHFSSSEPEVVAYNGKLNYVENSPKDKMTFFEKINYYYHLKKQT